MALVQKKGLEGFEKAWKKAAEDPIQREVQDELVDELYFKPAYDIAQKTGIKSALGQAIIWDTAIQHGIGGKDGLKSLINETKKELETRSTVDETTWLHTFLDRRLWHLLHYAEEGHTQDPQSSQSRIDALRSLLNAHKLNLELPLTWSVYGDRFTLK